jgi:hypothetical protein
MRRRLIPPIVCLLLLGGLAAVALGQIGRPSPARAAAVRATGAFQISSAGAGQPIFAAAGLAPGDSAAGQVRIEDSGSVPVTLTLARGELSDSPGIGGGVLSAQLRLTVTDVTEPGSPHALYSGPLDSMPDQEAGDLGPGGARTYEFVATLPDGAPSSQNALQGASTTVAYTWEAQEASGEEEPAEEEEEEEGSGEEEGSNGEEGGEGEEEGPGGGGGAGEGEEAPTEDSPGGGSPTGGSPGGGTGTGSGGGGGTGPGSGPTGDESPGNGAVAGVQATLDLEVPKILPTRNGRGLLTYVACDASCRIFVRGRVLGRVHGHRRTAKIHLDLKRAYAPGTKRLRIPIPRRISDWLRRAATPKSLRGKLRFIAVGTAGGRDVVKKRVRLRVRPRGRHRHRSATAKPRGAAH